MRNRFRKLKRKIRDFTFDTLYSAFEYIIGPAIILVPSATAIFGAYKLQNYAISIIESQPDLSNGLYILSKGLGFGGIFGGLMGLAFYISGMGIERKIHQEIKNLGREVDKVGDAIENGNIPQKDLETRLNVLKKYSEIIEKSIF